MAKKKSSGGGANWMDTYGDMVTLLLCFFVLLYSMSTISEDKWKAIVQSFNPLATQITTDPGGVGGPYADPDIGDENPGLSEIESAQQKIDDILEEMAEALEQMAAQEGLASAISVELTGGKIYVKFSDTVFFNPERYELRAEAQEVLRKVCAVLDGGKSAIEEIRIQGHTAQASNSVPNATYGDRRLASNRATEVVCFVQDNSTIHPARIISEGYGQWRPIGDNQGEAGKAPNRRVEMIISGVDLENSELSEALSTFISLDGGEP